MRSIKNFGISMLMVLSVVTLFASCGAAGGAKKPKGIILVEGDRATLTNDGKYTTIEFPEELTADDLAIYDTDFMGYLLNSNGLISTDGHEYDGFQIYYYLHNTHEWLHKGQWDDPTIVKVSSLKKVRISNNYMRLRDFNDQMPLLSGSKEKKNDQGYQDEVKFGQTFYYFIELVVRD